MLPTLKLTGRAETAGVETCTDLPAACDDRGVQATYGLALPGFARAAYYAAFQAHDPMNQRADETNWHNGANRCQALAVETLADLTVGGRLLLLELTGGEYFALLPLCGRRSLAWLESREGDAVLCVGTLGSAPAESPVPLCAWARSENLYDACRLAWTEAISHPAVAGSTRLRESKHWPDIFSWLGWCTWEQWHMDIDHAVLADAIEALEASDVPVRYVLIDDGHVDAGTDDERRLVSFAANEKFPDGLEGLLARRSEKLRWWGLWLNFNGWWGGISPSNKLGTLNEHLTATPGGALQPKEPWLDSVAFYDGLIGSARERGFDFVKVDNQAANVGFYRGQGNAVAAAAGNSQALETACARHTDGLINCMAHNNICVFNTRISAVTRCSEDYKLNDAWRAKAHLHNSYANMLWLGATVWGDHDMFHSSDTYAAELMARSKAISGGPIYLSDHPRDIRPEIVAPLCYADGRLLRPMAPAAPLPDSAFIDPFDGDRPFRAVAPLAGQVAAIVAYNLTEPARPVRGQIAPDDYTHAPGLCQPGPTRWDLPAEGLIYYEWKTGRAVRLDEPQTFELAGFDDLLALLVPVRRGWGVIGRADKVLSPAAVEVLDVSEAELILRMHEAGPLTVWVDGGEVACDRGEIRPAGEGAGLRVAELPIGPGGVVRLRR